MVGRSRGGRQGLSRQCGNRQTVSVRQCRHRRQGRRPPGKQGRIAVLRGSTARQATITATGASTAPIRQANREERKLPRPSGHRALVPAGPRVIGPRDRRCQWIEGEPGGDDSCKCLRETLLGENWCPAHRERVYLPPEVAEERFGLLPGTAQAAVQRRAAE